jgi:hypothetical protein
MIVCQTPDRRAVPARGHVESSLRTFLQENERAGYANTLLTQEERFLLYSRTLFCTKNWRVARSLQDMRSICTLRLLLWNNLNTQRSLKLAPFSLEGGNLLTQELYLTGMFNCSLGQIVVASLKGVCTTVVNAPKRIFHFLDEHIKGCSYILCVVFDHSLLDVLLQLMAYLLSLPPYGVEEAVPRPFVHP